MWETERDDKGLPARMVWRDRPTDVCVCSHALGDHGFGLTGALECCYGPDCGCLKFTRSVREDAERKRA